MAVQEEEAAAVSTSGRPRQLARHSIASFVTLNRRYLHTRARILPLTHPLTTTKQKEKKKSGEEARGRRRMGKNMSKRVPPQQFSIVVFISDACGRRGRGS